MRLIGTADFLRGDKAIENSPLILRALTEDEITGRYLSWLHDPETTKWMEVGTTPKTLDQLHQDVQERSANGLFLGIFVERIDMPGANQMMFSSDGSPIWLLHIGTISIHRINQRHHHAELGVMIGDKSYRHRGLAKTAHRLLIDHAFNRMNLHKLWAGWIDGNIAAERLYKSLGFTEEGALRDHFYVDGSYHREMRASILREEWEAKNRA
jgi:[ribosomal protein S5]-alanine N-acetyltransferase